MRRTLTSVVLALAAALTFAAPGIAGEVPVVGDSGNTLGVPFETVALPPLGSLPVYLAGLPAPGEILNEPLVVTDEELASVGTNAVVAAQFGGSPQFIVDGPPAVECPDADFASIQAAVTAAPPGSFIKVCPGLYMESVTVPKTLTLFAPRHHGQSTQCPEGPANDPTEYAIVDGAARSFTLQADDIVLDGFVVTGASDGIFTSPLFSGYVVRHNIAQQNFFQGIEPNSSGVNETVVERNCLRNQRLGLGPFLGLTNAVIEENHVLNNEFGMQFASGLFSPRPDVDVRIIHNDVINNSEVGIDAFNAIDLTIDWNHVVGSDFALSEVGSSGGEITFNLLQDGGESGAGLFSSTNILVRNNHAQGYGIGVEVNASNGNTIRGNKSDLNDTDGIQLFNSDNNRLDNNLSKDNGRDGIRVTAQSSMNTIEQNKFHDNVEHDCHDDTIGTGTAGTANFWIKNIGKTENRPGLCKVKP